MSVVAVRSFTVVDVVNIGDDIEVIEDSQRDVRRPLNDRKRDRDVTTCDDCDEECDNLCSMCSCCDHCCDFEVCQRCGGHCEGEDVPQIVDGVFYCEMCACTCCGHLYSQRGGYSESKEMCNACAKEDDEDCEHLASDDDA
jgi:hypothetical protein